MDRRLFLQASVVGGILGATAKAAQSESLPHQSEFLLDIERGPDEVVPLWATSQLGPIPDGLVERRVSRTNDFNLPDHAVHNTTSPTLSIFKPRKPNGSSLLIIPGGGYRWVVVEKEGWEGARYFNQAGTTVYVMTYRLPHQGWSEGRDVSLKDAQRAVRIIRSRAEQDKTNPEQLTVMGFSAGGHLAGTLGTKFDQQVPGIKDDIDELSARPDRLVLVYPVITMNKMFTHAGSRDRLIGMEPTGELVRTYSVEQNVRNDMPPTLILHAADDAPVPVENALLMYSSLLKEGVPASLHVFPSGGHGFGMRGIDEKLTRNWPNLVNDWMMGRI